MFTNSKSFLSSADDERERTNKIKIPTFTLFIFPIWKRHTAVLFNAATHDGRNRRHKRMTKQIAQIHWHFVTFIPQIRTCFCFCFAFTCTLSPGENTLGLLQWLKRKNRSSICHRKHSRWMCAPDTNHEKYTEGKNHLHRTDDDGRQIFLMPRDFTCSQ